MEKIKVKTVNGDTTVYVVKEQSNGLLVCKKKPTKKGAVGVFHVTQNDIV
jgi:hypothetical protein